MENGKSKREDVCPGKKLDRAAVERHLKETKGPEYWRSLEELAGSPDFQDMLHREFPKGASEWLGSVSRRGFLQLMGASLAMAGMSGCTKLPLQEIVPYVRQPEQVIPGVPMYYATAFTLGGYANPLLVESHLGRPTKIEGNRLHPASLGGTDVFAQASILGMYDPDRSQAITHLGDVQSWAVFAKEIRGPLLVQNALRGAGIRILTQTISSPTLKDQMRAFLAMYPQAKWHVYEPVNRDNALEGAKLACGEALETQYRLENAAVIVSLDADFLYAGFPGNVRYVRDFSKKRNPDAEMSRMYVVESNPSSTGAKADHRLPLRAGEIEDFAKALASALGVNGGGAMEPGSTAKFINAVAGDLQKHKGASVIIAGDHQPPVVHALAHAMNAALGNVGKTVFYTDPVDANPVNQTESFRDLVSDMRAGNVDLLVIMGGNPAYDAPADLGFADCLKSSQVALRIYHGLYQNETAELCHWSVNEAHYLEAWSDGRAYDGTVSLVQPLIAPLYAGKSAHEMLSALAGAPDAPGYDIVRAFWQKQHAGPEFEEWWRKTLNDGFIEGSAYTPKAVSLKLPSLPAAAPADANSLEVNLRRDPSVYDGQFSNNGWLQELPKPMSKLTWDNAVLISPRMADREGIKTMDVVTLELQGRKITGPAWIQAGHPDGSVTLHLGYGRRKAGRAGTGAGFDAYALRTTNALWFATGGKLTKTGDHYQLASTQGYQTMDTGDGATRPLVREATLEEYRKEPKFAKEDEPPAALTLYPGFDYKKSPDAWGMTIDLNACVGCNNCIVACQSENNIAVVGKEQVVKGRHMHWIRVDAYYQGDRDAPKAHFQPVPCMQCEDAPCELVCPVGATVHSSEGLNDQVYNRCIGTRYCSNNCPYKVRRFNFLLIEDWETPQYKLMRNPDVSVRSRGVMEKCTYCVQRISQHRIEAEIAAVRENRQFKIEDGSLQTACQQSCPADAIVFGNINDPNSRVAKLKALDRNYGLLADLNTRPRTTYLAEIRNPNPELET
ncbi:MAG TPA: TAT-variant-translocated molybdopterin oxidoreductase [Candidatus Acidoferrales bacterium]|nr:TAT-variant-translocated molybdopterin oxidoreductase [Candidatus Acidoferrales bacterium]